MREILPIPHGWETTYFEPSLRSETWELKEDLLQLHHPGPNRVADLGWYRDPFTAAVYQPDFQGTLLGERQAHEWYVANTARAPVLEYSRPPMNNLGPGRLYWADTFAGEPEYDRLAFGTWIDTIWGWVRASSQRLPFAGQPTWCFPEAMTLHGLIVASGKRRPAKESGP